jgi:hypothetical protein
MHASVGLAGSLLLSTMMKVLIQAFLISSMSMGAFGCSSNEPSTGPITDGSTSQPTDGRITNGTGGAMQNCPTVYVSGINAIVTDTSSGNRICDATVTITDVNDPSYAETLRVNTVSDCFYGGASDREGTYKVDASKSGYQTASVTVTVTRSTTGCRRIVAQHPSLELAPL